MLSNSQKIEDLSRFKVVDVYFADADGEAYRNERADGPLHCEHCGKEVAGPGWVETGMSMGRTELCDQHFAELLQANDVRCTFVK